MPVDEENKEESQNGQEGFGVGEAQEDVPVKMPVTPPASGGLQEQGMAIPQEEPEEVQEERDYDKVVEMLEEQKEFYFGKIGEMQKQIDQALNSIETRFNSNLRKQDGTVDAVGKLQTDLRKIKTELEGYKTNLENLERDAVILPEPVKKRKKLLKDQEIEDMEIGKNPHKINLVVLMRYNDRINEIDAWVKRSAKEINRFRRKLDEDGEFLRNHTHPDLNQLVGGVQEGFNDLMGLVDGYDRAGRIASSYMFETERENTARRVLGKEGKEEFEAYRALQTKDLETEVLNDWRWVAYKKDEDASEGYVVMDMEEFEQKAERGEKFDAYTVGVVVENEQLEALEGANVLELTYDMGFSAGTERVYVEQVKIGENTMLLFNTEYAFPKVLQPNSIKMGYDANRPNEAEPGIEPATDDLNDKQEIKGDD